MRPRKTRKDILPGYSGISPRRLGRSTLLSVHGSLRGSRVLVPSTVPGTATPDLGPPRRRGRSCPPSSEWKSFHILKTRKRGNCRGKSFSTFNPCFGGGPACMDNSLQESTQGSSTRVPSLYSPSLSCPLSHNPQT